MVKALIHSWWVFLFGFICYGGYDLGVSKQEKEQKQLEEAIVSCQTSIRMLDREIAYMEARLNAYDDLAFLELRLMARLGLVPKGETKVIFR